MQDKMTIKFIRSEFKKEGYTLLTKEYINAHQKLDYICSQNHKHSIKWNGWQQGKRCPYCFGNAKLTMEFIRSEFEKEGYKLLTTEYKNSQQKLDYVCPKGHKHSISWSSWQQGHRCLYCVGLVKQTIEFIKSEFEKEGYTLLTKEYINNKQKLKYICHKGHKHSVSWDSWNRGHRCSECANNIQLTIKFIKFELEKEGYTLLTKEYINNKQKLKYVCPNGHKHSVSWHKWQYGRRCPKCSNNVSKWEKEVKNFLGILNIDYVANDRNQLVNPKTNKFLELDVWFPQLNKAIECNGLYWHSTEERKTCDEIKQQLCKQKGIDLLVITDDEWNENIDKTKLKIKKFCNDSMETDFHD